MQPSMWNHSRSRWHRDAIAGRSSIDPVLVVPAVAMTQAGCHPAANATADNNITVSELQAVSARAVAGMDLASKEVETGISKLRDSVSGLEGIMRSSAQVSTMSDQISDAARQQGVASEEVANSMQQITDLIERNSASANSAKQAAAELLVTSRQLDTLIVGFELYRKWGSSKHFLVPRRPRKMGATPIN